MTDVHVIDNPHRLKPGRRPTVRRVVGARARLENRVRKVQMTDSINVPMTPMHKLFEDVTVIRSDVGWMRDDAKNQRALIVELAARLKIVEEARIAELATAIATAAERKRVAKLLFTASMTGAGAIAGLVSFLVNTWIKLHP